MVMVGDVCSAEKGGQGWCGDSFGLKLERKRKAKEGLLCLFWVTGEKEEERKSMKGGVAAESRDWNASPPFSRVILLFYFLFF